MARRETGNGFTVLELLAVLSLVSLVMVLGAARLGVASDEARFSLAVSDLCDLDARARLLSRTGGAVLLSMASEKNRVTLTRARDGAVLDVRALREGAVLRLSAVTYAGGAGGELSSLFYDCAGRSADVRVELTQGERRVALLLCGLTGQIRREEEPR